MSTVGIRELTFAPVSAERVTFLDSSAFIEFVRRGHRVLDRAGHLRPG